MKNELSQEFLALLRCPVCKNELQKTGETLQCQNTSCALKFPVLDGIPILINEQNSLFTIEDFTSSKAAVFAHRQSSVKKALKRIIPSISSNYPAANNYRIFMESVFKRTARPKVLVVGGSILGEGMDILLQNNSLQLLETDVSFGERTALICDAHDLPFADAAFDGVIAQAVLEHVIDPVRCVSEMQRILKDGGIVYAETPFMQQVHMGRYDFTRFTELGHRRLFRHFSEIRRGAAGGPGTALAWSYRYFLLSFSQTPVLRNILKVFSIFTSFFLKYFDSYLNKKPGAFDAASGYFFIGKKSASPVPDKDILKKYKGLV